MTASRTSPRRSRAGIAMATALGGLVIIGVMIAGVFFTSNQELRVGTNTFVQERAFRAAEFGVNQALANWNNAEMLLLPIGGTKETVYDSSARGWRDTVTVTRLNATSFLIGSTGMAFGGIQGTSRRRTALLVRISIPKLDVNAALIAGGTTQVGNAPVSGVDANPAGWLSCPPLDPAVAAIAVSDSGDVQFRNACPLSMCALGAPPILETVAAADTSTYFEFGDETWSSLTTYAVKKFSTTNPLPSRVEPVTSSGICDKAAAKNWGDPTRNTPSGSCESYFPIIHAQGSTTDFQLRAGSGQGILLVDGNLEISGDFTFYGPVIVRGTFVSKNTAKVHGTVMAANMNGEGNVMANTSQINYSSCAIQKAFENAIPPKRVVERAWMEVF